MENVPPERERDRGRSECESYIAKGQLRFYWQTRGAWGDYLTTQMDERFGVEVIHTSDMTTAAKVLFENGYNERMSEHINSTFGDESIKQVLADVEAFRERQYREHFGG